MSEEKELEFRTQLKKEEEKDPKKWRVNRARNYPHWQEQLGKIADEGIEKWKTDMIEPVKRKFPKSKK